MIWLPESARDEPPKQKANIKNIANRTEIILSLCFAILLGDIYYPPYCDVSAPWGGIVEILTRPLMPQSITAAKRVEHATESRTRRFPNSTVARLTHFD